MSSALKLMTLPHLLASRMQQTANHRPGHCHMRKLPFAFLGAIGFCPFINKTVFLQFRCVCNTGDANTSGMDHCKDVRN